MNDVGGGGEELLRRNSGVSHHCAAEGGSERAHVYGSQRGTDGSAAAATTGECRANFSACEGDARVRRPRGNE